MGKFDMKPIYLMLGLVIAMLVFPMVVTSVDGIMGWTGTGGNISQFTGLASIAPIVPLIILVVVVFALLGGAVVQSYITAKKGDNWNFGIIMGLIMMVISLTFYTIILDSVATVLASANIGDYTGLESVLKIVPMLILVVIAFSGVGLAGYSGAKKLGFGGTGGE